MTDKTLANICAKHGFPEAVVDAMKKIPTVEVNELTGRIELSAGSAPIPVTVNVGTYGAVGDGVALDSSALARAVAAAGVGGVIRFQAGKTYLVDRSIRLLAGQTVFGYGATVKRCAQILTTTTSGITSGSTNQVTAAAGTGGNFSVGQTVSAFNGINYGTQNVTISSIVGDVITTETSFVLSDGSPFSGSTTIALSFDTVITSHGCSVIGLAIDGNKGNWTSYKWEITKELRATYGYNTVRDCTITNAPGEGIVESGAGDYSSIHNQYRDNTITECNGNGIHLSASIACHISGNHIANTNLNGVVVGHNGGCITVSNGVKDLVVSNNHLEAGRCGVGQVDSPANSNLIFSGNTVLNMSAYMLEIRGYDANVSNISITGNRFHNDTAPATAALVSVNLTDTNAGYISNAVVSNNLFFNSGVACGRLAKSIISGNVFETAYQAADTYHNAITSTSLTDVVISNNTTKFGNAGIVLGGNNADVLVSGNGCHKSYYYGINSLGGTNVNVLVANNAVTNDTNVNGSYQGITVGPNTVVRGNNVNILAGHCGIRVNAVANVVVQSNTVRASAAGKTIRVETGSTGYVVAENQVNYAITDTPAVGVRVANNDVIA